MKVLIWIVCILCASAIQVFIKNQGIILGGIPTALLMYVTWFTARKLCKVWDNRKSAQQKQTQSVVEEEEKSNPVCVPNNAPIQQSQKQEPQKQVQREKRDNKALLFLYSHRRFFTILLIVSFALLLVGSIGYEICNDNMEDASHHYDIAFQKQQTLGCGRWECKYCEGEETPVYSFRSSTGLAKHFRYYNDLSDNRDNFEIVGVISLVLSGILLVVFLLNRDFHRKKKGLDK